jgi:hypothetical protein
LKTAAGRLGIGLPAAGVTGLTPAAKAMYAAASAVRARTVLVVPTDADVERTTDDARFFLAALEGLSDAEVSSCRFLLTKWIPIEGWRLTSTLHPLALALFTP